MLTTTPSANGQPQTVQYTPNDASAEKSVGAFSRPSSSSLPFVSANAITNLIFQTNRPTAPKGASQRAQREPAGGGARALRVHDTGERDHLLRDRGVLARVGGKQVERAAPGGGLRLEIALGMRRLRFRGQRAQLLRVHEAVAAGTLAQTRCDLASRSRDSGRASPGASRSRKRRRRTAASTRNGPVTASGTRRFSFHASYSANPMMRMPITFWKPARNGSRERRARRPPRMRPPTRPAGMSGRSRQRFHEVGHVLGADAEVGEHDRERLVHRTAPRLFEP